MGTWRAKVGSLLRRRAVRLGLLAAALLLGGLGVFLVFSGGEASRHRKQAEQALDRQDLAAACDHLRHYVAARPGDAEGHYLLARTLRREGRYDEAERHLAEAGRRGFDAEAVRRETFLAWLQQRGMREVLGEDLLSQAQAQPTDRALLEALYRGDLAARNWDRAGLWLHLWLERHSDEWAPRLWQAELL